MTTKRDKIGRDIYAPDAIITLVDQRREKKALTARALSRDAGLHAGTWDMIVRHGSDIRVGTLIGLAKALGVKPSRLLADAGF